MRYSITLSYNGSGFCGWQIQPADKSVQESLQNALSLILGETITVTGAGRTDTGVNAVNYVAHFDVPDGSDIEPEVLEYKLNAILGRDIAVHAIVLADNDFHARFSAVYREYKYFLHRRKDPFINGYSWFCRYRLDIEAMNEAAEYLIGTHDFRCFEKKGGNNRTSVCTIRRAGWESYTPYHVSGLGFPAEEGDYLVFTVGADRFLRNMVRAIVGSLIDVGRGKRDIRWFMELIAGGSRSDAGESVPGHALFLNAVDY